MQIRIILMALAAAATIWTGASKEPDTRDLSTYWPGDASYALWGRNVMNDTPTVLWFEWQDGYTFRQYNSDPEHLDARCNFDTLSWWDDGYLRYLGTTNVCAHTEVRYDPPIIVMPKTGSPGWSFSQTVSATSTVNGEVCHGENTFQASVVEPLHVRSIQTTVWDAGQPLTPTCAAGYTTRWQEDYWFGDLPGGHAMIRSAGGNLDVPSARWDVRYSHLTAR